MTFVKPEMTNVIFFYFLLMKASLKAEQPGPCRYHISLSRLSTLTETTLPPFLQLPAAVIIITQRPVDEIQQTIF